MDISREVYNFNLPHLSLRDEQLSLINFMYNTNNSLANSPRSSGVTTAMFSYIAWLMGTQRDQEIAIFYPNQDMAKNALNQLDFHCKQTNTQPDNKLLQLGSMAVENLRKNRLRFNSINNTPYNSSRGLNINEMFFDDWDVFDVYANRIQLALPTLLPSMAKDGSGKVHIIGTTSGNFVDQKYPDDSLIANSLNGTSYFKLWNYLIEEHVDELLKV